MAEGHVLLNRHTVLLSQTLGFLVCHLNAKVNTSHFFDSINHAYTAPSWRQVNLLSLVVNLLAAKNLLGNVGNHALSQVHNVFVVSICFVQLDHRKFRIMAC
ncbi:hypothetical protein D3C79_958050 [compost metagenome]